MKGKEGGDLLPAANLGARYVQESKRTNGNIKHEHVASLSYQIVE
jgi:hypothetical protein